MKSPAFQFYPTDWLGSQRVQMLTLEEEGIYVRLVCYCWQHGSIPADSEQAAKLVGKGATKGGCEMVLTMFQPGGELGRLTHERLEIERAKQAAWREKSSKGGRKSAKMRESSKGGSRVVEKCLPPKGNTSPFCLQSPSSNTGDGLLREFEKHLRTARMTEKWEVWMECRRGMKKPKSLDRLFNEQIEWLGKFTEPEAFEILSSSIRNGYQGLFEPKKIYGNNKNNQSNNPRLAGIATDGSNYGDAAKRKMERQVAKTQNESPSKTNGT